MFRLQENVPEVYLKYSRDFQLFCRIFDVVNNAVIFDVKSTENLLNPLKVNDLMLPLIATRVGFFPKSEYNNKSLRWIIAAFPYIMKYKGSKQGIALAFNTILKSENNYSDHSIIIDSDTATVKLYSEILIQNELLLRDVLSYVLPIGYRLEINFAKYATNPSSQLLYGNTVKAFSNYSQNTSVVINSVNQIDQLAPQAVQDSIARYNLSSVLSADDLFISDNTPDYNENIDVSTISNEE